MAVPSDWMNTDYYEVLHVAQDASDDDIRRAYRKLARELHPDANDDPAAERRFREVTAAHEVLGDPHRRKEYDELRRLGPRDTGRSGGRSGDGTRIRVTYVDDPVGDVLGDVRSGRGVGATDRTGGLGARRRTAPRPRPGSDVSSRLSLPFLDAIHGTTTAITLISDATCDVCNGTGTRPGTTRHGSIVQSACPTCGGSGQTTRPRTVNVRIPAGVDDGRTIRLPERGAPGRYGGPPGDLYVVVDVEPHPDFGRLGDDITITVPVTYPELVLGADVVVPTVDAGAVTVRVPPGTPSGRTLRVPGRGVPGTGGDLLVTLEVTVPVTPTETERELIEQLDAVSSERPRARWEAAT